MLEKALCKQEVGSSMVGNWSHSDVENRREQKENAFPQGVREAWRRITPSFDYETKIEKGTEIPFTGQAEYS